MKKITAYKILGMIVTIEVMVFYIPIPYVKLLRDSNIILRVLLRACETWDLTLNKENRLSLSEHRY